MPYRICCNYLSCFIMVLVLFFSLCLTLCCLVLLHHVDSINIGANQDKEIFLNIMSLGHAAVVFVNKRLIGM